MKSVRLFLIFLCQPICATPVFETLKDMQEYAQKVDEYPPIDNTTWANPDYTSYLRSLEPNFWQRLAYDFGIAHLPIWHIQGFKSLLMRVVEKRERNGYIGRFVQKMKPVTGSSFIIWGDVQGAYHSLVRVLTELHKKGIINEQLEIIRPYVYFVFNGDLINRAPYSLEVLTVVMKLLHRNPDKVFYIRGNHEDRGHWKNFNLKRDLIIRAASVSDEEIPLEKEVDRFFNTLPLALYLVGDQDEESINLVRISHYGRIRTEMDEEVFSGFFARPASEVTETFKLNNSIEDTEKRINVRAIVRGESRLTVYRPMPGLSQLEADKGSTAWTVLSSPTESYRHLQDFYHDAYVVLDIGKTLNDWTITLYNQDVRELLGFKKVAVYNLVTGLREFKTEKSTAELDPFVSLQKEYMNVAQKMSHLRESCPQIKAAPEAVAPMEDTALEAYQKQGPLIVGTSLDLSGPVQEIGKQVQAGLKLKIDQINKDPEIERQIQMIILDDAYKAKKAVENMSILQDEYNTPYILSPIGTPTLKAYLDLVKQKKILVMFPTTGSMIFRKPELTHVIHLRASDNETAQAVAQHMVDTLDVKNLAVIYQDDDYGIGGLKAVQEQLQDAVNIQPISYLPHISDVKEPAEKLKQVDPDGVLFISTPLMARKTIKRLGVAFFKDRYLGGTSDMGEDEFQSFIDEKGLPFIVGNIMPDPDTSDLPIVKEFRAHAHEHNVDLDAFSLEAYINAKLFAYLIEQASAITPEALIKAAEQIKDVDFGGLNLTFEPSTRQLLHTIWLDVGDQKMKKIDLKVTDKPAIDAEKPQKAVEPEKSKTAQAVKENGITFGSTLGLTRGGAFLSQAIKKSIEAQVEVINRAGGIHGKKIRVVFLDDQYDPSQARKNVETFLHEVGTDFILSPVGSPTTKAYLDLIQDGSLFVFFPVTGATFLRDASLKHVVNFRVSFEKEMLGATQFLYEQGGLKKIAVFYQNDDFGHGCLTGVQRASQDKNIELLAIVYNRNDINFRSQVKKILAFKPDAIAFGASSIAAQGFIRQADVHDLADITLYGCSDLSEQSFQEFLKQKGLNLYVANVLPSPQTSEREIVREYRRLAQKQNLAMDPFGLEGYVNTQLTAYILEQIEGPITKDAINRALSRIQNVNFKGLKLNFDSKTRELSDELWISQVESDEWEPFEVKSAPLISDEAEPPAQEQEVTDKTDATQADSEQPTQEKTTEKKQPVKQEIVSKPTLAVKDDTIVFGSTLDLTKGVSFMGKAMKKIIDAQVQALNRQGGIHDKRLQVIFSDDQYEPDLARQNIEQFLKDVGTDFILNPIGSATTQSYVDLIKDGSVLVFFPITGASFLRDPALTHVLNFRTSYIGEMSGLTSYVLETENVNKIAVFYQGDSFGESCLAGVKKIAEEKEIELLEVYYDRNDVRFGPHVDEILNFEPDAIAFGSTSVAAKGFIRQATTAKLGDKVLLGCSDLGEQGFQTFVQNRGLKVYVAHVVPNPNTSEIPIAKEYRSLTQEQKITIDTFTFEAYINTSLAAYLLENVEGVITKEKVIKAVHNTRDKNFKGLKLDFNSATNELSSTIWISLIGDTDWKRATISDA